MVRKPKPDSWTFQTYWSSPKSASGNWQELLSVTVQLDYLVHFSLLFHVWQESNLQQKDVPQLFYGQGPILSNNSSATNNPCSLCWGWGGTGASTAQPCWWCQVWPSRGPSPSRQNSSHGCSVRALAVFSPYLAQREWKTLAAVHLAFSLFHSSVAQLFTRRAPLNYYLWTVIHTSC